MITNSEYKSEVLAGLRGNWALAVLSTPIYLVIAVVVSGGTEIPRLFGNTALY